MHFKGFLKKFKVNFREVSKVCQGSFKGVLRKTEGCLESPLRVIQCSLKVSKRRSKGVSRQFQR